MARYTKTCMEDKRVAIVYHEVFGEIYVHLYVLGKVDVCQLERIAVFGMLVEYLREAIKQIARLLDIEAERVRISQAVSGRLAAAVICIGVSHTHYEYVFISVDYKRINGSHSLQIIGECGRHLRHIDIADIEQVETMSRSGLSLPTIAPCRRSGCALKLGTDLPVVLGAYLGCGVDASLKR